MKAEHLMIGNLIKNSLSGEIIKVSTHEIDCAIQLEGHFNKTFEPIPLTEEWLLRLGFEKVRYEKYAHCKVNKLRAYPHVFNNGFGFYLMGAYSLPHIEFVHQLQNLYFTLTGEELTLKNEGL